MSQTHSRVCALAILGSSSHACPLRSIWHMLNRSALCNSRACPSRSRMSYRQSLREGYVLQSFCRVLHPRQGLTTPAQIRSCVSLWVASTTRTRSCGTSWRPNPSGPPRLSDASSLPRRMMAIPLVQQSALDRVGIAPSSRLARILLESSFAFQGSKPSFSNKCVGCLTILRRSGPAERRFY